MFHQLYCISQLLLEYKMNKSMITVSIFHENYLGYSWRYKLYYVGKHKLEEKIVRPIKEDWNFSNCTYLNIYQLKLYLIAITDLNLMFRLKKFSKLRKINNL